jgi:hypothetical protein
MPRLASLLRGSGVMSVDGKSSTNPAAHARLAGTAPVRRAEHAEDSFTRVIEQQAAKIPSHLFLSAALLAMGIAAAFELQGNQRASRFVGAWPAPLLLMGVYNKLVKTLGTL